MTAEKYAKQIVKKIMCSSMKKHDIKKQLLAEIGERRQAGEALSDIMTEMGTAQEIADSFNDSISEEEKKHYKIQKRLKMIIPILFVLVTLGFLLNWYIPKQNDIKDSKVFVQEEIESRLISTIDLLEQKNYDTLQSIATDQMKSVLCEATMENVKNEICENWGTRSAMGNIYEEEITQMNQHFAVCQVNVSYENVSVTYTISFDENMNIAGLYLK